MPCYDTNTGQLTCDSGELLTLLSPTNYAITLLTESGYLMTFNLATGFENSSCSGLPTLIGNSQGAFSHLKNSVFRLVDRDIQLLSDVVYYLPATAVPYSAPVYIFSNSICVLSSNGYNDTNAIYYKPLINDPSVTGYDPTVINALQKPFRVSID